MTGNYRLMSIIAVVCLVVFSSAAWAQVEAVTQVLEEVVGFSDGEAIRVNREDASLPPISQLDVVGSDFRACELTAKGLVCLAGNDIYVWTKPAPLDPADTASDTGTKLFSCVDDNLPFDKKKNIACTSATANAAGDEFVVGGKGKGKLFDMTLVKACADVAPPGTSFEPLRDHPSQCFTSLTTGRPLIVTLEYLKEDSSLGAGILTLEERTRASLVGFDGVVTDLGDAKAFGLKGNERLTGLTALRLDEESFPAIAANDYLLATTTRDGIIALSTDNPSAPVNFRVFDIQAARDPAKAECVFDGPQSPISTGFKSGFVYVTDGQYCDLYVLKPAADPLEMSPFILQQVAVIDTQIGMEQFALEGVTAAPGITIDLATCELLGTCTVIPDNENGNGKPDVVVLNLKINDDSSSFATVYQIKNAPDCRYIPETCADLEQFSADYEVFRDGSSKTVENAIIFLIREGVIRPDPENACTPENATGPGQCMPGTNAGGWQLNVARLMPTEITDAATIPDPFVISRKWRGQKNNGFIWEALFVDAQGVVTEDTFEIIFDTEDLVTSGLGNAFGCNPAPGNLTEALEEDLVTTVSENFLSGSGPNEYRDTLTNAPGCGSSRTLGDRFSLKPYNFEKTPGSFAYGEDLLWESDGLSTVGGVGEVVDDAVFIKLVISLWGDLGDVLNNFACDARDGQTSGQPFLESDCNTNLVPTYDVGTDKLEKCWAALRQPKKSAGDQNCSAWLSQTDNLRSKAVIASQNAAPLDPDGNPDFANRKGEVLVRIDVLLNLFNTRVVPFVGTGYCEPDNPEYLAGCP